MADDRTRPSCPFCGRESPDHVRTDRDILRAVLMSQILPALAHGVQHRIQDLHMGRMLIERELGSNASPRLREVLKRDEMASREIHDFVRNLRTLYRGMESERMVALGDMPERLQWFLEMCEFPGPVDFTPLRTGQGRISFPLYWDAFSFAVQGGLVAIRRDREPSARLTFDLQQHSIMTTLYLTHESALEESPLSWRILEWLIPATQGWVKIEREENHTTVSWGLQIT